MLLDRRPVAGTELLHGSVDVLKNAARLNAQQSVGLYEVVAAVAVMFAAESVDECKGPGKAFRLDQEPGAINLPIVPFFHVRPPLGEAEAFGFQCLYCDDAVLIGWVM